MTSAIHTRHGFIISTHNTKMGYIPSFSVHPAYTCASNVPCWGKCYARRMANRYPSVDNSYRTNYINLAECPAHPGYGYLYLVADVCEYIQEAQPRYFRWDVAGDIFDLGYLYAIDKIATECPDTDFLVYTKQYDVLDKGYNVLECPDNLHIYLSVWGDYKPTQEGLIKKFHIAYYQDKDGIIGIADNTATVCPGKCTQCKKCFKGLGNVIFREH